MRKSPSLQEIATPIVSWHVLMIVSPVVKAVALITAPDLVVIEIVLVDVKVAVMVVVKITVAAIVHTARTDNLIFPSVQYE